MVYVPANSEREDGPRAKTDSTWSLFSAYRKQKGEKGENKKKPAAASGPLNMAGAQPVPIIMRPTVTTPGGTVVVVTQPTTTTPGGTMVVVQVGLSFESISKLWVINVYSVCLECMGDE